MALRTKSGILLEVLAYCEKCKKWTNHIRVENDFVCNCGESLLSYTASQEMMENKE